MQYQEGQEVEETNENLAEILGMGDHGDDFAKITIRTEDGEEVELEFKYDGDGMIHAEHNGKSYSIPVEVEVQGNLPVENDNEDHEEEHDEQEHGEGKAHVSFTDFVNECWSPMNEGYNPAMSEEAKRAVKTICEELLMKEAKACHEDSDPMHTYENYLNECGQYMTECMMEAASNMDV